MSALEGYIAQIEGNKIRIELTGTNGEWTELLLSPKDAIAISSSILSLANHLIQEGK